jgi:hypothetical protein
MWRHEVGISVHHGHAVTPVVGRVLGNVAAPKKLTEAGETAGRSLQSARLHYMAAHV